MARIRTYRELRRLNTFEERFDYLSLAGQVGRATFGFDRWLNQNFYMSREWKYVRDEVIVRDNACDLGIEGHEIRYGLLVHHMNPITPEDLTRGDEAILDPDFLIVTSRRTHNAIHYGNKSSLPQPVVARQPGDTKLW